MTGKAQKPFRIFRSASHSANQKTRQRRLKRRFQAKSGAEGDGMGLALETPQEKA
jgi:hypothetical protein